MGELVTYVLLSVLLVFGIYSFWKQSKNKLPTLDLEKIKSQIDAIIYKNYNSTQLTAALIVF
jgi:hypothetical protein